MNKAVFLAAGSAIASMIAGTGAYAQTSSASYLKATRYDAGGRVVGTISAPPDVNNHGNFLATRNSYDTHGRLYKIETGVLSGWQGDTILPENWIGFDLQQSVIYQFDDKGRKTREEVRNASATTLRVTDFSYDVFGRPICTAVRMDPAQWNAQTDACVPQTNGPFGADRITKNTYDAIGQVTQIRKALGTTSEVVHVTYSYTPHRQLEFVIDANGNRAKMEYDGLASLIHQRVPNWVAGVA